MDIIRTSSVGIIGGRIPVQVKWQSNGLMARRLLERNKNKEKGKEKAKMRLMVIGSWTEEQFESSYY